MAVPRATAMPTTAARVNEHGIPSCSSRVSEGWRSACYGTGRAMPLSALAPAGTDAEQIATLFAVMAVGAAIVWVAVVLVAVHAVRASREARSPREANLLVVGGGVALPTVVLGALLLYGLPVLPAVLAPAANDALRIHITGKQWWWRVQYMTPAGIVETANELRLPVGQRVELQLTSPD